MKALSLGLLGIAVAASNVAMACPHTPERFICPGDSVVDSADRSGTVLGVNPFQHRISYSIDYVGNRTADVRTLALGEGCLEAVCVGDTVVDSANRSGTALAVNPYTNIVAYSIDYVGTRSANVRSLKVAFGCTMGYCVGDEVVDSANRAGTIVALSPYEDSAAYSIDYVGTRSSNIESLSSTQFCEQYGSSHPARLARHYPNLPVNRYAAPTFRFYLNH